MVNKLNDFKTFCEARQLTSTNFGDVIEGVFAICTYLYLLYGTVDPQKVDYIRSQMDPGNKTKGLSLYKVTNQKTNSNGIQIPVALELYFKTGTTKEYFGPDSKQNERIDQLVNVISSNLSSIPQIEKTKNFLNTLDKQLAISAEVRSIGADTAQEGSKEDIEILIKKDGEVVLDQDIVLPTKLSLKFNRFNTHKNQIVSNLGFLTAVTRIANDFGLPLGAGFQGVRTAHQEKYWSLSDLINEPASSKLKPEFADKVNDPNNLAYYIKQFLNLWTKANNPSTDEYEKEEIPGKIAQLSNQIVATLKQQLEAASTSPDFSKKALDFLVSEIYGKGSADVISIAPNSIHQLSKDQVSNVLQNNSIELDTNSGDSKNTSFNFNAVNKSGEKLPLYSINLFPSVDKSHIIQLPKVQVELGDPSVYNQVK